MMKILLTALSVFVFVIGVGYCIVWYSQANATKAALISTIERINKKEKYITYQSIETSGFPSDIFVSIIKPHFTGRIDPLLNAINQRQQAKNGAIATSTATPIPEWDEDLMLDGRIIAGINMLSDHYSLKISGNWHDTTKINGQSNTVLHQQLGDMMCALELQRGQGFLDTLWNFKTLSRDSDALIKDFRMVDCYNPGNSMVDESTKAVLSSNGPFHFYVMANPTAGNTQTRVYFKLADFVVTQQGDALMSAYMHTLSPTYPFPINFSLYGKQNFELDFSYNGQTDWQKTENPAIDIALSKLDITNEVYNHHLVFHWNNTPGPVVRKALFYVHGESNFTEHYDTEFQTALHGAIQQFYTSNDPHLREFQATVQKYTPDELYSIIYPAIPNFHSLGKIVESVDASFEGKPDLKSGDFTLNDLEFSASPYGIKGNGSGKVTGTILPAGTITLQCMNCVQMIDDMTTYEGRIQKIVSYFDSNKAAAMLINPPAVSAIKDFLKALATKDPANTATYIYTISSNTSGVTLNGKTAAQLKSMYKEYVEPALKAPDSAADTIRPWHSH